jgi:hypothetical protein
MLMLRSEMPNPISPFVEAVRERAEVGAAERNAQDAHEGEQGSSSESGVSPLMLHDRGGEAHDQLPAHDRVERVEDAVVRGTDPDDRVVDRDHHPRQVLVVGPPLIRPVHGEVLARVHPTSTNACVMLSPRARRSSSSLRVYCFAVFVCSAKYGSTFLAKTTRPSEIDDRIETPPWTSSSQIAVRAACDRPRLAFVEAHDLFERESSGAYSREPSATKARAPCTPRRSGGRSIRTPSAGSRSPASGTTRDDS